MKHVVRAGENPATIAQMYTGDPWRFSELVAENPQIPTEVIHLGTVGAPAVRTFSSGAFAEETVLTLPGSWACENCGEMHAGGTVGVALRLRSPHLPGYMIYTWDSIIPGQNYTYIEAYFFGVVSTGQVTSSQYPKSYVQKRIRDTFTSPADAIVKYNQGGLAVYPSAGPSGGPYVPANATSSIQSMKFWNFILSEIKLVSAYEGATSMEGAMQGLGLTGAAKNSLGASNTTVNQRPGPFVPWGTKADFADNMPGLKSASWDTPNPKSGEPLIDGLVRRVLKMIDVSHDYGEKRYAYLGGWSEQQVRSLIKSWIRRTWATPWDAYVTLPDWEEAVGFLFVSWVIGWDLTFGGKAWQPCSQKPGAQSVPVPTGYVWDPIRRSCVKAGTQALSFGTLPTRR